MNMRIIESDTVVGHHYESVNMVLVDDSACQEVSNNFEEIINFWEEFDIRKAA